VRRKKGSGTRSLFGPKEKTTPAADQKTRGHRVFPSLGRKGHEEDLRGEKERWAGGCRFHLERKSSNEDKNGETPIFQENEREGTRLYSLLEAILRSRHLWGWGGGVKEPEKEKKDSLKEKKNSIYIGEIRLRTPADSVLEGRRAVSLS